MSPSSLALPSSYVLEMLHKASRLVSKAGGHVLSKRALKHFAMHLVMVLCPLRTFSDFRIHQFLKSAAP